MCNGKAGNCSNERSENNQFPCCKNFYRDEGECKECLPGYFGTNCQTSCVYPYFGKYCMNTCDCNISDCDNVSGCQGNDTEIQITAECLPGYFGMNCQARCVYPTFGKICMNTCVCNISDCDHVSGCQGNDSEIQITAVNTRSWVSLSVNPNFPWSYSSAATPDYSTEKEEPYNDRDNDLPSIYTEIDERSEQESESNTMRANVTSTSFMSLNGIETRRPQLPVRNTQLNFC
uniref:EGF-like domain-containing protein n=1 Tax=Magallana gigas TaxID=29159 RepID=A0A8W8LB80_MAGGI